MPRKKSTSDEHILEAARIIFLEEGLGASTRHIARAAGVSEGVLFQRYGSKQNLFFAAMRVPAPELRTGIDDGESPQSALQRLSESTLDYFREIMPIILLVLAHPSRDQVFRQDPEAAHKILSAAFGLDSKIGQFLDQHALTPDQDPTGTAGLLLSSLIVRALHEQMGLDDPATAADWLRKMLSALIH